MWIVEHNIENAVLEQIRIYQPDLYFKLQQRIGKTKIYKSSFGDASPTNKWVVKVYSPSCMPITADLIGLLASL